MSVYVCVRVCVRDTLESALRESSTLFNMPLGLSAAESCSFPRRVSRAESWDVHVSAQAEVRTSAIAAVAQQLWVWHKVMDEGTLVGARDHRMGDDD